MPNAAVIFFSHRAETYDPERTPTTLTKGYAEIVARRIAAAIEAPTFQVIPERDYSRDHASCMAQAKRDKEEGVFPELLYDMDPIDFKSVVLVYPNWFGSCPMPMFTYLSHHSFEGKKVIPVCVHDGKGIGQTEKHLKAALPGARLLKGISVPGKDFPSREQELLSSVKEALAASLPEE